MSIEADAGEMEMLTTLLALVATISSPDSAPRAPVNSDRASLKIEVSIRAPMRPIEGAKFYAQDGRALQLVVEDKVLDGHPIRIVSVK